MKLFDWRANPSSTLLNLVQENEKMDEICGTAVPVFQETTDNLGRLPKCWPGYMI